MIRDDSSSLGYVEEEAQHRTRKMVQMEKEKYLSYFPISHKDKFMQIDMDADEKVRNKWHVLRI